MRICRGERLPSCCGSLLLCNFAVVSNQCLFPCKHHNCRLLLPVLITGTTIPAVGAAVSGTLSLATSVAGAALVCVARLAFAGLPLPAAGCKPGVAEFQPSCLLMWSPSRLFQFPRCSSRQSKRRCQLQRMQCCRQS
jgi:hypothetical protein